MARRWQLNRATRQLTYRITTFESCITRAEDLFVGFHRR